MPTADRPPSLAVIVANGITGDSRVQKVALAAARDGWDVTLIGKSPTAAVRRSALGPVSVIRVPVQDHYRRYVQSRAGARLRRRLTQSGLPDKAALAGYRAAHRAWLLEQDARLAAASGVGALWNPARLGWKDARDAVHRFRDRLWGWEQHRRPESPAPVGRWRTDWPAQVDFDLAFVPLLVELAPDVIHANDITMIGTAAQAAARLRLRGERVAWVYDAHEYVAGVDWPRKSMASAFPDLEREFIGRADAVVTVSPEIADRIRADHRLPETPLVVRNVPVRSALGHGDDLPSVRRAAGLADDVPLLVYSGWLAPERGLRTAAAGLVELPDFHLAIVSNQTGGELDQVRTIASDLGVWDRIHVVPYVPQHQVPDYLSTADLGLICSQRTLNYELSLPTKLSEYVHGRLPVIASDVRALRATVEQHGFGQVFTSDDPASFAAAVRRGYAERAAMAARITDDFLTEFSWEAQSAGLVELYRRIAPRVPQTTRPDVPWTVAEGPDAPESADRSWRRLTDTPVRLGLGAANYAAQGAAFARAVTRAYDDVSAEVFMYAQNNRYGFPADVYLDVDTRNSPADQVAMLRRVRRYTHLLVDAFRPVLGHLNGSHIGDDLRMLASDGIRVGLLAHGSDVRDPVRHMDAYAHSLFHLAPPGTAERLTAWSARNRALVATAGLPAFVTTPDLLEDLPTAVWTPVVVDLDAWRCESPVMRRARPVVLHAPTNRWTKGTDLIMPGLEKLDAAGLIELRLVEGLDWAGMRAAIHDADVVVDQVTTGAYGTLAVEAMAAGRIVLAHISDHVRTVVGTDLAIVDITPETLVPILEGLVDDRGAAAAAGAASVEYATKYHDGAWTARALRPFLHDSR